MKQIKIWLVTALLAVTATISAVPAHPGAVKAQQPDGSYVTIMLRGDEWLSYNTTADGYSVVKNDKGYYVYAQREQGRLKATQVIAHDAAQRPAAEQAFLAGMEKFLRPDMTSEAAQMKQLVEQREAAKRAARRTGGSGSRAAQYDYNNFRGLVILIEYNDKSFSRNDYATIATNMFNQENYTGFYSGYRKQEYTGSVRDYFSDNSLGQFKPQFDVYGPYQVEYSQYSPRSTANAGSILKAAVDLADADIDFSQYDRDGDGIVDMIYFIVAGNGANYTGNDSRLWWPHRSILTNGYYYDIVKDNVALWDYASSTELAGYTDYPSTVMIDGIGTVCHEFSHVLGLPDFYDTDYEQSGGESNHPGQWSLMAGGSYENNGRTPVGYSLYERWSVGFCDAPETISEAGTYSLEALDKNQKGFYLPTPVENEFFLLENRQKSTFKWDAYLPGSGLLVHRVDFTDPSIWSLGSFTRNTVNANPAHNYYEVVRANGSHTENGRYVAHEDDVFPAKNKTELTNATSPASLLTWAGEPNSLALTNISMKNGVISFAVTGYEVTALTITPETVPELGTGVKTKLTAEVTPAFAQTDLVWSSDDPAIATVDQQGVVTGISEGTTTIRVLSDNFIEATCTVTVKNIQTYTVAEFKQQPTGTALLLKLTDAAVLTTYQNTVYLRDATGCIMLTDMNLGLKQNDIVSGVVAAEVSASNNMPQAVGTEATNTNSLTITAGSEVQPREVHIEDLTEADYCDYVLVKAGRLKADGGVWVVNANNEKLARLYNTLKVSGISLKNYDGNYYDIPAIYGTNVLGGSIINELYMLKTPTKVDVPTGITTAHSSQQPTADSPRYNLNGQRVSADYKGLVIQGGRKSLKR